ncbi:hypothetical protein Tco_0912172 [Tanacetum coccineum]
MGEMKEKCRQQRLMVDSSKALDASLVDTESSGTALKEQDTSSRSGNDAHADDADIRPIYDEEPMAEISLTNMNAHKLLMSVQASLLYDKMTSDHNSSELRIHDHSNELSSTKLEDRFKYLVRRIGMRCLTPAELEVLTNESA